MKRHASSVCTIVQSVPGRRELRSRLLCGLTPGALVVEDEGTPNPWRGYQKCLYSFLLDRKFLSYTHVLVIQDDAIVCENFTPAVDRIVELKPDNPICLFFPGRGLRTLQRLAREKRKGIFFPLNRNDYLPVVAVVWPRDKAKNFLHWAQGAVVPGMPNPLSDDAVAGSWMRFTKQDVYLTIPSLVQHPDDVDPVKGGHQKATYGRDRGRVAHEFCSGDPLVLDWV